MPVATDDSETPEEQMEDAYRELRSALAADLLDRVREQSWQFFEDLVLDVLRATGYGHAGRRSVLVGAVMRGSTAGFVEPKSRAGRRRVPVPSVLREALIEHKMLVGRDTGLVFGRSADSPFSPSTVNVRAAAAWNEAELEPIGLHECRHTCASYFIAAGINAKTLSTFLGHASITTTLDRYGHLFPGSEAEAAGMMDAYLARADSSARLAQLSPPGRQAA